MKRFAQLIEELDGQSSTRRILEALESFYRDSSSSDALWALGLFSGKRPRRAAQTRELLEWAAAESGLPLWLVEECRLQAGDLAETLALLIPMPEPADNPPNRSWDRLCDIALLLDGLSRREPEVRRAAIVGLWRQFGSRERWVVNKMISGAWRIGVSEKLAQRALAGVLNKSPEELAFRLSGAWHPRSTLWDELFVGDPRASDRSKPFPFQLAQTLDPSEALNLDHAIWAFEPKWDGIRAQWIRRSGCVALWSRGMELITPSFPELETAALAWTQDAVLDGELLAGSPESKGFRLDGFSALQKRARRKKPGRVLLAEQPVFFMAYDLLEFEGTDLRALSWTERRRQLEAFVQTHSSARIGLSPVWSTSEMNALDLRANAARLGAEGLMIKLKSGPYKSGRAAQSWYKFKIDPLTIDAVLLYATQGRGQRAGQFTDFTFGLWNEGQIVPFAKAYSGLGASEIAELDRYIKQNLRERFGPVYGVKAEQVFELAFEGVHESPRHKSGLAVRFPRIVRWRRDKTADQANTLEELRSLMRNKAGA
ncbi:ATP-dependent DNA ligase [bacterium]|nr:ATP-dependent DNA ligase [bacterium]